MKQIRWGIIGCGGIAHKFASSLKALDSGELVAGASQTVGRAAEFADTHGFNRAYTNYNDLVQCDEVDAIYVATTHNFHYENVKLCLEHNKHVLCEKPMTLNAGQSEELAALAKEKNLFLMEGMWTRFLPVIAKLREQLKAGAIGNPLVFKADFSFKMPLDPEHRLRNKALAGGALLDLGVYPIAFAAMVFNSHPEKVHSTAIKGITDVDETSLYQLEYPGEKVAQLSVSCHYNSPIEGIIHGSEGYIRIPAFMCAKEFYIHPNEGEVEHITAPFTDEEGFKFEIDHAMQCISDGKLESDVMPLSETIAILKTMDLIREQWGLTYPYE